MQHASRMPLWVLLIGFFASATALAQPSAGVIRGVVADDKGKAIPIATVRATHDTTQISSLVLTDAQGRFSVENLVPGKYAVTVKNKGFRGPDEQTVNVKAAAGPDLKLTMRELPRVLRSELSTYDIGKYAPEGPGKNEFVQACSGCHGLERSLAAGRDKAAWKATVIRMAQQPGGYLNISDKTQGPIVDYLAAHFGPDNTLADDIGEKVKNAKPEVPLGSDLKYTQYNIPTINSLPHTAMLDASGKTVWFSEYAAGIIGKVNLETGVAKEFKLKSPDHHPHGVTIGPDGIIWFAAPPYVLGRIDPKTEVMEEIRIPAFADGKDPYPHSLVVGSDGKVWFSETHRPTPGGLSSYDPKTKKFQRFIHEKVVVPYGMIEHDGIIWFTVMIPGRFGTLDPKTGAIQVYDIPTKDNSVRRLRFDSKGRAWFGEFATSKIGVFDPKTKKIKEYDLPARGTPYSIHVDADDNVWSATYDRDTLVKFDPRTEKMTEYPMPGYGGLHVRDMWPDSAGKLNAWWFAHSGWNQISRVEIVKPAKPASPPATAQR